MEHVPDRLHHHVKCYGLKSDCCCNSYRGGGHFWECDLHNQSQMTCQLFTVQMSNSKFYKPKVQQSGEHAWNFIKSHKSIMFVPIMPQWLCACVCTVCLFATSESVWDCQLCVHSNSMSLMPAFVYSDLIWLYLSIVFCVDIKHIQQFALFISVFL